MLTCGSAKKGLLTASVCTGPQGVRNGRQEARSSRDSCQAEGTRDHVGTETRTEAVPARPTERGARASPPPARDREPVRWVLRTRSGPSTSSSDGQSPARPGGHGVRAAGRRPSLRRPFPGPASSPWPRFLAPERAWGAQQDGSHQERERPDPRAPLGDVNSGQVCQGDTHTRKHLRTEFPEQKGNQVNIRLTDTLGGTQTGDSPRAQAHPRWVSAALPAVR